MNYVVLFISMIPAFVALDLLWLGIVAKDFYQSRLGHLLGPVEWPAAIAFYALFIAGVMIFVVLPGIGRGSLTYVVFAGLFFGLVTYGTYDLTNLATLKGWPLGLTVVDMIWGAVLSAVIGSWGYIVATRFIEF